MNFIFWLALVIGGGLFLLSLLGDVIGIEGHEGHAFHSDTDTDWGRIFSLRNATYFLFAFGAVGVLLTMSGRSSLSAMIFALLTGAGAWGLSHAAFSYLRRTDARQMPGDELLVGRVGMVSLPIVKGGTGKIVVEKSGHTQELLAKPHDDDGSDPASWDSVIVIDVRDGVALVAPFTEAQYDPTKE